MGSESPTPRRPGVRLVTREQFAQGYVEKIGNRRFARRYELIARLPEGILVREPDIEGEPLHRA